MQFFCDYNLADLWSSCITQMNARLATDDLKVLVNRFCRTSAMGWMTAYVTGGAGFCHFVWPPRLVAIYVSIFALACTVVYNNNILLI